jgi:plasmid maintenance system antidote protein VapI
MDYSWFQQQKKALRLSDSEIAEVVRRDRTLVNKIINGKGSFPADRANELADLFQVTRNEILVRLGLLDRTDLSSDEQPERVLLQVLFPSAPALTDMFVGMLEAAGYPQIALELAPQLARRLPAALARSQAAPGHHPSGDARPSHGEDARRPSRGRPSRRQQPHT